MKFKPGDKVICVRSDRPFPYTPPKIGKIYTISKCHFSTTYWVKTVEYASQYNYFYADHFVPADLTELEKVLYGIHE